MNYGTKMKAIRTSELWSQEKVADKLNIKRSTYKEYELQNSIIPLIHLIEFCNTFKISLDYLFAFTNNKNYSNLKEEVNKAEAGQRLKAIRKEIKLTQTKLANILNTTQSVIAGYEQGRYLIATPFLYTICLKYNISADYILGRTDNPKYLK